MIKSKTFLQMIITVMFLIPVIPVFAQYENGREQEFETDAMNVNTINGLIASQRFGNSVANCGDLNGDGYDDIIVGAHLTNSSTGRAYIYFGGQNVSTTPSLVLNGEAASNFFGLFVSDAGDVNGDGYADVIVGAYGYSSGIGRAYIYYGGYNMDNIADVVLTGSGIINFGYSVSNAGDVNGDGFSDVIVSGHAYLSNRGRAYIYYGGLIMDNVADKTLEGFASGGNFGFSLTGAGDVNGDGFSDVLVGAYAVSSFTGAAYLYYGGNNMDTIADITFTGEATNSFHGHSVADAGDVNGDGYSDLLIGATQYSSVRGRAYIYYGGSSMNNVADVIFTGELTGIQFGRVSGVGDVNGDGFSDILIGAQGYQSLRGRAYLFYGGTAMNNVQDMVFTGEASNNSFGWAVGGGGDINGDGYKDFIVGAYGHNSNRGKIYIYKNSLTGKDVPDVIMNFENSNSYEFGHSVSIAGDLNGDGYDDYIVGDFLYNGRGKVYIYIGSITPDTIADITITSPAADAEFGYSVSGAGDVNADGYDDFIVGAKAFNGGQGRAYLYYGGAVIDTVPDFVKSGSTVSSITFFGHSVSSAGDINGDGYDDIIIGGPGYLNFRGYYQVFFGGNPIDTNQDYTRTGGLASESVGNCVSNAGDVNGDGYDDAIIAVVGNAPGNGHVQLLWGGSFSISYIYGGTNFTSYPLSVSDAGDLNSDGYDDFLIGVPYSDSGKGTVIIYYGNAFQESIQPIKITPGHFTGNSFGYSVSAAGDVNKDGFDDIIISDSYYFLSSNLSRGFIYFGGYNMDTQYDIMMDPLISDQMFGASVSGNGDVNGDGLSDVLVGSLRYQGAAYLYLSSAPSVVPSLLSVKDVPNDQGGKVNLKWTRSAYDVLGIDMITDYLVQRSMPPGGGGFFWENIAVIPATRESYYALTDNTPSDSTAGNSGTLYYRITARTSNQNNYWRSNILYGRSIDNIAPLMVSPFTAAPELSNVRLEWKRSTAPDLLNYILFRSTSQTINPNTETPFASLTDSTYLDTSPLTGLYYYFIVAQDIHNNFSPISVAESPNMTLNLTVFLEGFYNQTSNSQISDTVIVELRNSSSPYSVIDISKRVISGNGSAQLKFGNATDGNYYFSVRHRNCIETWNASPVAFSRTSPVNYDMSSSTSQAYGNNITLVDATPLRYAAYSGDVNQDGIIDGADGVLIDNDAANFEGGYLPTDLNGDEIIDGSDALIADNNAANFVTAVTP